MTDDRRREQNRQAQARWRERRRGVVDNQATAVESAYVSLTEIADLLTEVAYELRKQSKQNPGVSKQGAPLIGGPAYYRDPVSVSNESVSNDPVSVSTGNGEPTDVDNAKAHVRAIVEDLRQRKDLE